MTETYIVEHNIPLRSMRIILRICALAITAVCLYHGIFLILIFPLFVALYTFAYSAVDIHFEKKTYSEYLYVLGAKIPDRSGTLLQAHTILLKDTNFVARNSRGIITNESSCYEVALVGENRFKLILIYAYDADDAIYRVLHIQEKSGLPISDYTHEQLIGSGH